MATVWYNTDTGEVFRSLADAVRDAAELYDYGDDTNAATWEDMPYIEVGEDELYRLSRAFGGVSEQWRIEYAASRITSRALELMEKEA